MKTKRFTLLLSSLAMASAMLAGAAQAHGETGTTADDGHAVVASAATKVITISSAKPLNVNQGDIVKFVHGSESFTFDVHTYPNITHFNLARIEPKGMHFPAADVYVGPNPVDVN